MTVSPIVALHISAGTIGILSGAAALLFRKGSGRHQMAGKVFVLSMLTMAASGSVAAYLIEEWSNVLSGITTIYYVTTAWMTLKRPAGESGLFEIVAFLVAVAGAAGNLVFALHATNSETGLMDGIPAGAFYVFAAVITLFAVGDLRLILRRGIAGTQRIARHLVRMCYAMFVAAASLFLGQMQVFPDFIRETGILFVLPLVPLVLMIFWVIRVRFTKWGIKAGIVSRETAKT